MSDSVEKLMAAIWWFTHKKRLSRTSLNKILFFSDGISLVYNDCTITDQAYIKQPYGPVPSDIDEARNTLLKFGLITETTYMVGSYYQYAYGAIEQKVDEGTVIEQLGGNQITDIMQHVIDSLGDHKASELSDLSHQFRPWIEAEWYQQIDMNLLKDDSEFKGLARSIVPDLGMILQ